MKRTEAFPWLLSPLSLSLPLCSLGVCVRVYTWEVKRIWREGEGMW